MPGASRWSSDFSDPYKDIRASPARVFFVAESLHRYFPAAAMSLERRGDSHGHQVREASLARHLLCLWCGREVPGPQGQKYFLSQVACYGCVLIVISAYPSWCLTVGKRSLRLAGFHGKDTCGIIFCLLGTNSTSWLVACCGCHSSSSALWLPKYLYPGKYSLSLPGPHHL